MNNKQRIKLIAYLTASSMLLYGCKMTINNFLNKDKQEVPTNDFYTEQTTEEPITETELVFENTIDSTLVTEPTTIETKEQITDSTTISIAPVIETTTEIIETETTTIEIEEQITKPTTIPIEPEVETTPTVSNKTEIIVRATTNVNIRSNNTTNALVIGELKQNDTAYKIMSYDNDWDLVKVGNQIGYISSKYLEDTNETYELEYKYTPKKDIVITKSDLNFRELPTKESKQITSFKKNTELEQIATLDNGWLLVRNNGILGYVHGDYVVSLLELTNLEYPELELKNLDIKKIVYTTSSSLNIRKGNNTDYESIGKLEKFESVRVIDEYDGWYFIMTNDYKFGFVSKEYTEDMENNYVIVDKSEQKLYLYNDDELLFVTPVTTGKDKTPSDTGLFQVWQRVEGKYLVGEDYKVWVDYWVAYNRGEGLHDASWRSVFGTESYHTNGSHGCINIPPYLADDIYYNTSYETKVLVHK